MAINTRHTNKHLNLVTKDKRLGNNHDKELLIFKSHSENEHNVTKEEDKYNFKQKHENIIT